MWQRAIGGWHARCLSVCAAFYQGGSKCHNPDLLGLSDKNSVFERSMRAKQHCGIFARRGFSPENLQKHFFKKHPRNSTVEEMFVKGFVKRTPDKRTFIPQHRFSLFFAHYMR